MGGRSREASPYPDFHLCVSELVAKIVGAYLRRHQVPPDELAALISAVQAALAGLSKPGNRSPCRANPRTGGTGKPRSTATTAAGATATKIVGPLVELSPTSISANEVLAFPGLRENAQPRDGCHTIIASPCAWRCQAGQF